MIVWSWNCPMLPLFLVMEHTTENIASVEPICYTSKIPTLGCRLDAFLVPQLSAVVTRERALVVPLL